MFYPGHARIAIGFAAYVLIQTSCVAQSVATGSFEGRWAYRQSCGAHHSAELNLSQSADEVLGSWSDGDRSFGSDGRLKGQVRQGKLFVRYCGNDLQAGYAVCPDYEAEEADYFVRQGDDLVWYRMAGAKGGTSYEKYLTLHPLTAGKPIAGDNTCEER